MPESPESVDHGNFVSQSLQQSASSLSSNQLLHLFEAAMGTLCQRAYLTLGDVTLTAVVDRVVYNAGQKFPIFESLDSGSGGVNCNGLREHAKTGNEVELREGIRFVLVEFLTVIGNLTAEVLTPALHSELSRVLLEKGPSDGTVSREGK